MSKRALGTLIAVLFIISGATGLVYQIVWFKYLSLFLGNSTQAQAIVLATFMGGLAIGATLWGRRADRAVKPLRIYALLEIAIACYCLLYPTLLSVVKRLFISFVIAGNMPSDSMAVLVLKLLVSASTLLLPTILMGGTLPVLVKFLTERVEDSGTTVARLYFVNSLGAVLGSIVGGFYFVQSIGLASTMYVVAVLNLVVGVVALLAVRLQLDTTVQTKQEAGSGLSYTKRQVSAAIAVAGLSGLAAMIYEVTWVRLLIPVLGSSTYSFTLMLVAFISGITFGSWLVGRLLRRTKNLLRLLAYCQAGVAISLFATLPIYGRVPFYFWQAAHILSRSESTYPLFLIIQFLFGFAIMVVPTIFLGMSLPIASRIASSQISILGKTVGNIFSINTLGTVIGALGAGLVLIPLVGLKHTIECGIAFNIAGALIVTFVDTGEMALKRIVLVSVMALTATLSLFTGSDWNKLIMLSGVFRLINKNITPPESFEAFASMNGDNKTLFYKEGASATVAVLDGPYYIGRQRVLFVNGKPDASSAGDLPTQELIAQIPLMLHQNPQDVLVVGLGSGVSLGSALTHNIRSADCVELIPEVVEASKQFEDVNHRPLSDPRTRLHVDDALSYLKLTDRKYDVIVSEPTNPWIAGVGNLFTNEFFARCKDRLNSGGIMVQWFHLYEMDDETIRLVLRTFRGSFQNVSVWQSYSNDVILVGSSEPIVLNAQAMKSRFEIETVKRDLYRLNIPNPAALLSLQMVSPRNTGGYAGAGDINTEDLPLLEYRAPRAFFVNRAVTDLLAADERLVQNKGRGELLFEQYQQQYGFTDEEIRAIGALHAIGDGGNLAVGHSFLLQYLSKYPEDADILQLIANVEKKLGKRDLQINHLATLASLRPNDPRVVSQYGWEKFQALQASQSSFTPAAIREPEEILNRCVVMSGDTVDRYHVLLGDMYAATGNSMQAVEHYRKALEIRERYGATERISQDALLVKFARAISHSGDDKNALAYAMQAFSMNPQNSEAKEMVYTLYTKQTGKKLE